MLSVGPWRVPIAEVYIVDSEYSIGAVNSVGVVSCCVTLYSKGAV